MNSLRERAMSALPDDRPAFMASLREAESQAWCARRLSELARDIDRSAERNARRPHAVPRLSANLPVHERRSEIAKVIDEHRVCILCGETGSGKTTQLPQICLSLGRGRTGMIGHTQPRRLAARSVAARIAEELGVMLGDTVGFKVRFGDRTSERTRIKVMTDGILLAETQGDPDLWRYDTLIIDEAHERSLNIDFLLGYIQRLLPRRPDLKVIITSATIDPHRLSEHFGGPAAAPIIEVSGRTYPVEVLYRPVKQDDESGVDEKAVADAVEEVLSPRNPTGDVLVFLPGEREIRECLRTLRARSVLDLDILPLYSRLTNSEQDRIFRTSGKRRIILATNVAETSLTVPGIRYVVDTGLSRQSRYDPRTRVQRLPIAVISQASADQRAGRCGRIGPGICVRLYSRSQYDQWPKFTPPEVLRTNLASVILQMKSLGLGPIEEFPFVDPPSSALIHDGYQTLHELSAIDAPDVSGNLTEVGLRLAKLPVDPRIGRMILAAEDEGCVREVVVLAAALSIQDPRDRPMSRQRDADTAHLVFWNEHSDFLVLLNIWDQYRAAADSLGHSALHQWCRDRFINTARMREWTEVERQLRGLVLDGEDEDGADAAEEPEHEDPRTELKRPLTDRIHRALMTGLLSNVCCRDEGGPFEYQGSRGNRVSIFPGSVLFRKGPKWMMAAELVQTTKLFARTCAKVDPAWIEELASHVMQRILSDPHFDRETGAAMVWERLTLAGAVVVPRRKVPFAPIDPAAARAIFVRHALASDLSSSEAPFAVHNRAVHAKAAAIVSRLRRRDVLRDADDIAAWFEKRLGPRVCDPTSLESWRREAERDQPRLLFLNLEDVVKPEFVNAAEEGIYPGFILCGNCIVPLTYTLSPGREEDGITGTVGLLELDEFDEHAAEWLVPGFLHEKVLALLKTLPRASRSSLEDCRGGLPALASECAGVMSFGRGRLGEALSEAVRVLRGRTVPTAEWNTGGLPDYLRIRLIVLDEHGKELGEGRDIAELKARLAGRVRKAKVGIARTRFEKTGLTTWSFGALPDQIDSGDSSPAFPMLFDAGDSVMLTLSADRVHAEANTERGIRRLFVLSARDELFHRVESLPGWDELRRQHRALGSDDELRDALACHIADRAFLFGQPRIRSAAEFESRQQEAWGRLGQATIEIATAAGKVLDARFKVAARLAGGTPRQWAASVADMREHAAYLMPRGFMKSLPWERLREYPRYAEALRARLLKLREDGRDVEGPSLAMVLPQWKRLTAWVAAAMSRERTAALEAGDTPSPAAEKSKKQPLPGAKRAAPTINVDAGEWAMRPGALPDAVHAYRWAVEELRVGAFAPELGMVLDAKRLDELWAKV
ncbi:MAG: ATP-dependent RNA helicase HrpA [Phycisphaerae bacterium]|nr:ATP-dependent RNA helicase HrpA [Phycisphaerae bacterium]